MKIIVPEKSCPECGASMTKKRIKKGTMHKRSMWRYNCACGHTEAVLGIVSEREDAIAEGLLDDEIGIPKYPDAQ